MNEKSLARELGAMTAEFAPIDSLDDLTKVLDGGFQIPAVLKTRRVGYDGKGQAWSRDVADAGAAWAGCTRQPAILEG